YDIVSSLSRKKVTVYFDDPRDSGVSNSRDTQKYTKERLLYEIAEGRIPVGAHIYRTAHPGANPQRIPLR
ncbi:MAG TPA: hypothetical protein VLA04_05420, partial [Verrucomicrobiae bacterium]|nr:hypothetical protein [Verrucomicrobiae bacterium]